MQIKFDYRFDTQGFFTSEHQAALEQAAAIWSGILEDDFPEVPAFTELSLTNPQTGAVETITLEEEIDDLVIFVGAAEVPFNESTNDALAVGQFFGVEQVGDVFQRRISANFRDRGVVTDFEPWFGAISFLANPERAWNLSLGSSDSDQSDFLAVALREIGRILGIGSAPIFAELAQDGFFTGVNVSELNNGEPLLLDPLVDSVVLGSDLLRAPTDLDLAILADIGYEIAGLTRQGATVELATETAEIIQGTNLGDRLRGLAGDDTIRGNDGEDTLLGDEGNDLLVGNAGADTLNGGLGADLLQGDEGNDLLLGSEGTDTLEGSAGDDTLRGNDGNDVLFGGSGNDFLIGNSDNDSLQGNLGNDVVRGGDAGDTLEGNSGDDTLEGGRGNDSLVGGAGSDRFEFGLEFGTDRINDFSFGEDLIVISAEYDFATDSYDLNSVAEILASLSSTDIGGGSSLSEITPRGANTVEVIHDSDRTITEDDLAIYLPFQSRIIANNSGFIIELNQAFELDNLNLYQGIDRELNFPDLRLVANSTGRVVEGSLVATGERTLRFVQTDGILAPDEYSLTLFSRRDSFVSDAGEILDGDVDGIAGDNFVSAFTIAATEQRDVSVANLSQGAGDSTSVEVVLDDGTNVTSVDFSFTYDPNLLDLDDLEISSELPTDWQITAQDFSNPGEATISLAGTSSLPTGVINLVDFNGVIPETAIAGSSTVLNLEAIQLNQGSISAIGDSGVQLINSVGDTNSDSIVNNLDVLNISYLATGISDGISNLGQIDPQVFADLNGDGVISALDSYLAHQSSLGS